MRSYSVFIAYLDANVNSKCKNRIFYSKMYSSVLTSRSVSASITAQIREKNCSMEPKSILHWKSMSMEERNKKNMEEKKGLLCWIKNHKKELVVAGIIGVGTLILIILKINNQEKIKTIWEMLKRITEQQTVKTTEIVTNAVEIPQESLSGVVTTVASNTRSIPFEVSQHIRNLPGGWHASAEKIGEALEKNIILMEGQTLVDSYLKGGVAA